MPHFSNVIHFRLYESSSIDDAVSRSFTYLTLCIQQCTITHYIKFRCLRMISDLHDENHFNALPVVHFFLLLFFSSYFKSHLLPFNVFFTCKHLNLTNLNERWSVNSLPPRLISVTSPNNCRCQRHTAGLAGWFV